MEQVFIRLAQMDKHKQDVSDDIDSDRLQSYLSRCSQLFSWHKRSTDLRIDNQSMENNINTNNATEKGHSISVHMVSTGSVVPSNDIESHPLGSSSIPITSTTVDLIPLTAAVTTMEEVKDEGSKTSGTIAGNKSNNYDVVNKSYDELSFSKQNIDTYDVPSPWRLFGIQFYELIKKRYIVCIRDWKGFFFQVSGNK